MIKLNDTKYVISPPGNGIDCIRTWESLAMGAIPIVMHTTIARLYINMPIIVVKNWSEISDQTLIEFEKTTRFASNGVPYRPKIWATYWFDLLQSKQMSA